MLRVSAPSFFQVNTKGAEKLVELAHRVAELGKDAAHKLEARRRPLALPHARSERLARDELHHHNEVPVAAMALQEARQVRKADAATLRGKDLLVRTAQTGFPADALAHERPQLGAVLPAKVHALGSLQRTLLEHRVNAVAGVTLEGGEVAGEFVFRVHAPILAELAGDEAASAPRRPPS